MYSKEELADLQAAAVDESRKYLFLKRIPQETRKGVLDPRVLKNVQEKMKKKVIYDNSTDIENLDLMKNRLSMGGENTDLTSTAILIQHKLIQVTDHYVAVTIYQKEDKQTKRAALLFMHGGGYFGGSVKAIENQLKLLAEKSNAVIFSAEYRLAPENPFPKAIEDVSGVLGWIQKNALELAIDEDKISIGGESAGGNLAAVCALESTDIKLDKLLLVYPGLKLGDDQGSFSQWVAENFQINPDHKEEIYFRIHRFKNLSSLAGRLYVQSEEEVNDPRISPFFSKNLQTLPDTFIAVPEYDILTPANEQFAELLVQKGIKVKLVKYLGMDHGFFDRLGEAPQTEDLINELALFLQ